MKIVLEKKTGNLYAVATRGTETFLQGLSSGSPVRAERISHIRRSEDGSVWEVVDRVSGEVLHTGDVYADCVDWEIGHYEGCLGESPESIVQLFT